MNDGLVSAAPPAIRSERLVSLDAYRGFVMLLMASGGLYLDDVADRFPDSGTWQFIKYQVSHAAWTGCALWDLIQPSFMFLAGASIPFSYASRRDRGQSGLRVAGHVLWRSLLLILLGIFVRSDGRPQTNFTFEDVLTQIGMGYAFVYLLVNRDWRLQSVAAGAILVGYWYLFFQYPLPGPDYDYARINQTSGGPFTGFAAHWNINTNFAADVDVWFLNLFPRSEPFRCNGGGYLTLNFVPSMATMLFGLMAGQWLRTPAAPWLKAKRLAVLGSIGLLLGFAMDGNIWPFADFDWTLCPIVKRIWTPSWVIFSTGWTLLLLSAFYWLVDVRQVRRPVFPLVVVGMNSIAMYLMADLAGGWFKATVRTHLGPTPLGRLLFDGALGKVWLALAALLGMWLVCLWMYRRRIFLRV